MNSSTRMNCKKSWVERWLALWQARTQQTSARSPLRTRPRLEVLEDRITPSGFQTLHNFTNGNDGGHNFGGLTIDSSGTLYGTEGSGGTGGWGTVFKLNSIGVFTTLHSFSSTGGGTMPDSNLLMDSKGSLYGTTFSGGSGNNGTVFEIGSDGSNFNILHNFDGSDGSVTQAGLIMDSKGNLFGTTYLGSNGQSSNSGTVFELSPNGTGGYDEITLHAFVSGTGDGLNPEAGLLMDSNGNLYGSTTQGGASNDGTLFKLSPNGSGGYNYTRLRDFSGSDGKDPFGTLIMDNKGNLYGTTAEGGVRSSGTVFEINSDGSSFTILHNFTGQSDGGTPYCSLLMDNQGDLYGTTYQGAASNDGTVFELSPSGSGSHNLTTLHTFTGSDGANPHPGLVADASGNLYGTSDAGGSSGYGTIFELPGAISLTPTTTAAGNATAVFSTSTQNVTLTADVTSGAGTVKEGTVTFTVLQGSTIIGTATTSSTVSNGQVSVSYALAAGLDAGTYTIDAVYNPGLGWATSSDITHTLTVNAASTTTAAGNATAVYSTDTRSVTLAAEVTSSAGTVNGGTMTFTVLQGSTIIGTATTSGTVSNGQFSVSYALPAGLDAGTYTINAVYNPDPDFGTNSDSTHTLTVTAANTVTNANGTTFVLPNAQSVTLSASIVDSSISSDTVNEGTVTFTVESGQTVIGTPVQGTVSDGTASAIFSWPAGQAAGSYTIAVRYGDNLGNFTDGGDNNATLTVLRVPAVATDPSTQTVTAGQTATFTVAAGGNPPPTVQWQVSTNGGNTFSDISGATSTTLTLSNVLFSQNGEEYRAVFSNSVGSATTTAATLTVLTAPSVTIDPNDQTVTGGQSATFTAGAGGNPAPSVRWEASGDQGLTWTTINGITSNTLIIGNALASSNGKEYRAVFSNSVGTVTTTAATLTVLTTPLVTTSPSDQTVTAGQSATFTVAANGNPAPTVQWQVSNDEGQSWTNLSGSASPSLVLSNVLSSQNGEEFRAVFTNSVGEAMTNPAMLTVQTAPTVTTNPSNQTVTTGQTATFTAAASGNPAPTMQWQVSGDKGKTWTNLSGDTSTTLTLGNVSFSHNGEEYRAVFSNSVETATTNVVTLTVQVPPVITRGNSTVFTIGQGGSFAVTATGSPTPSLAESGSLPYGITFTDNGNGTALIAGVPAAGTQGTYHISIVAFNGVGSDFTQDFTLIVNPAPASPPPSPPPSSQSSSQPPILNVPSLLALIDSLLGMTETFNANGTETIANGLFGITLVAATYDSSGNFVSATLLGFNLPNWVWFF